MSIVLSICFRFPINYEEIPICSGLTLTYTFEADLLIELFLLELSKSPNLPSLLFLAIGLSRLNEN